MQEGQFLPASRSIGRITVEQTAIGEAPERIRLEWTDGDNQRQELVRKNRIAAEIISDLHACTILGESVRIGYLIGLIRGTTLRGHNITGEMR